MSNDNYYNEFGKFKVEFRTFETRLTFIKDIFSNPYTPEQIMASSIQYKLDKSFENYIKEIHRVVWQLHGEDPIKLLKKVDK